MWQVIYCVGGVFSSLLANLFFHYAFDGWMGRNQPNLSFEGHKDGDRVGHYPREKFNFLGFTFQPWLTTFREGKYGVNFSPAVSAKAIKSMRSTIRSWRLGRQSDKSLVDFSRMFKLVMQGWVNYYGSYRKSALSPGCAQLTNYFLDIPKKKIIIIL